VRADRVADFDTLYRTNCAGCHGADGMLGPAPPLNDPLFLAIVPDGVLLRVIRDGRAVTPGQKSPMPGFAVGEERSLSPEQAEAWARVKVEAHADPRQTAALTRDQVRVLAEGIKKRWGPPASPTSAPPYLAKAEISSGTKDEGARVFARACAGCHGQEGEGVERDGRRRRKINDPAFLALISDQELRRYAITGRPDLGMPPYDGKADGRPPDFQPLTSEEIDGLVALLASWRLGGPAAGK
jgi:cytochrome c oxidase cbb3-type subunit 3/ubiquinol-cytochrome c reductase cytochrome c subunit